MRLELQLHIRTCITHARKCNTEEHANESRILRQTYAFIHCRKIHRSCSQSDPCGVRTGADDKRGQIQDELYICSVPYNYSHIQHARILRIPCEGEMLDFQHPIGQKVSHVLADHENVEAGRRLKRLMLSPRRVIMKIIPPQASHL